MDREQENIINLFEDKHGLIFFELKDGICWFGDKNYFNFEDVKFDIETNQPKEIFLTWFDYAIATGVESLNYKQYCDNVVSFEFADGLNEVINNRNENILKL